MPKTREELTRRRREILSILDSNAVVENLDDLLDQLEVRGFRVSKASVSRDLKELGIARVNGRFRIPTVDREDQVLHRVVGFIRKVVPSGPFLTVIQCDPGTGQAVATALKSREWEEIAGVVADSHTAIAITAHNYDQKLLLGKLKRVLGSGTGASQGSGRTAG